MCTVLLEITTTKKFTTKADLCESNKALFFIVKSILKATDHFFTFKHTSDWLRHAFITFFWVQSINYMELKHFTQHCTHPKAAGHQVFLVENKMADLCTHT